MNAGYRTSPYSQVSKPLEEMDTNSMKEDFDIRRNLIVNYLPPTLSQDDVKMMFCRIGPVSNCKLVRNHDTGQSLGYAFIEFPTEQLAIDAITQIDGIQMQGKTLKVSYARQSSPEIKNSNVYVAGLPLWVTEDKLLSLFQPFGQVITHKLLYNPDNSSRGVGFVRYSLKSEAHNAIEGMSGKTLPEASTPLTVKLAIPPASKQQNALLNAAVPTNAVVGIGRGSVRYNPLAPSNQMVLGQVSAHPAAPQPAITPTSTLDTSHAALATFMPAVNAPNKPPNIMANPYVATNQLSQVFSVYVYGLQPVHSELTLYQLFSPFGGILNVKLIRDLTKEDQPCKGYGFVNFRKYEEAYSSVITMNNCPFEGKNLQVSFKQSKHGNAGIVASPHAAASHVSTATNLVSQQRIMP